MQGTRDYMKPKKKTVSKSGVGTAFKVDAEHAAKEKTKTPESAPQPTIEQKALGRPANGKRSNPDYRQTSMYLTKQSVKALKQIGLDTDTDFSDLVQTALDEYLKKHKDK